MKSTIVLLISVATILAFVQAQIDNKKGKGEVCLEHRECKDNLKCAGGNCGCTLGHLPEFESHAQGSGIDGVYVCKKVVGQGCDHNDDCSLHLENSRCDDTTHECVCNKDDGCTDGAVTLTVMSTVMMGFVVALIKVW